MVNTEAYNTGLSLLRWLELGLVDEVVIGLDDSAQFGLNVKTFNELKAYAARQNQQHAYFLHGADELSPLIIARHCLDIGQDSESFILKYLSEEPEDLMLPYEAIPLTENFQEKAAYLFDEKHDLMTGDGNRPVTGESPAASRRLVRSGIPKYIYLYSDREASPEQMKTLWQTIRKDRARPANAFVGLADIAKTNGAWAPFIESAGPDKVIHYVDAYAGWNTAGNSLGTVMAHLLYWESAQSLSGSRWREASVQHENLRKLRLIDDYFYQSKIRQEIIDWTVREGFPYLTFGGRWMEANDKLQEMMDKALAPWPMLMPVRGVQKGSGSCDYRFPWPRSFEIRIEVQ